MKISIYLTAIATTIITCLGTGAVRAQGVFVQPFPSTGYSSTIIYVPSTVPDGNYNNRTIEYESVNPNIYPTNGYYGSTTTTIYDNGGTFGRSYRDYRNPARVTCSTSIIGSPIPSPIALGTNGQPCR
ncbi:hypothetical protein [Chamaesiphon polymorphus]|uniref:Uncharacterized protein n=1 Tax=Chamaesiphon polymorphus CCALA 037 TaxID=2107692 RepID=A0A2T1GG16_9CYAN|nr:hypothetical protein [Chamaesiphon polymorphus]PSB56508.1 hypothetical protein C7B77_11665 [Chamaesiphon polymorphus CCALA 037]